MNMSDSDLKRLVELAEIAYAEDIIKTTTIEDVRAAGSRDYALLARSIEDIEWATRVYNVFRNNGIKTLGDVVDHTEQGLLRTPNLGRKSVAEIKEALKDLGLRLAPE